jgi:hypothetical protein
MPDADDFDIEYFRNLLKGNVVKKEQPAPAEKPAAMKRKKRSAAAPLPSTGKGKPATSRQKPGKR